MGSPMKRSARKRRLEALNEELRAAGARLDEATKLMLAAGSDLSELRRKLFFPTGAETSGSLQELNTTISKLEAERSQYAALVSRLTAKVERVEAEIAGAGAEIGTLPVPDESDYFAQIRKLPAPSSLQKCWRRAQADRVYLCHCPPGSEPPLPLSLVHPAFARFADSFNNTSTVEFGGDECQLALDLCSEVGSEYYHEEGKARAINRLIGNYLGFSIIPMLVGNSCLTDGSYMLGHHLIYTSEYQKEEGNSLFQAIHYYGLYLAGSEESVTERTVCPCFLVELVGVHMRISGLAYLNKVACQPITTFMHCYTNAYDKTDLDCLCRALWALRQGISELQRWYGSSPPLADKRLPYHLQAQPVQLKERIGTKLLFVVEEVQSKDLKLVKYCKRYGGNVHAAWAGQGLAPKLLRCEGIAGGWVAVEMEYLCGPEWKTVHEWAEQLDESRVSALQSRVVETLKEAHRCTYEGAEVAHGDLRAPNIMARAAGDSFEIKFLDFDWSGPVQSTVYPSFMNTRLPWHKDAGTGKPLQQDHDQWWADMPAEAQAEATST